MLPIERLPSDGERVILVPALLPPCPVSTLIATVADWLWSVSFALPGHRECFGCVERDGDITITFLQCSCNGTEHAGACAQCARRDFGVLRRDRDRSPGHRVGD